MAPVGSKLKFDLPFHFPNDSLNTPLVPHNDPSSRRDRRRRFSPTRTRATARRATESARRPDRHPLSNAAFVNASDATSGVTVVDVDVDARFYHHLPTKTTQSQRRQNRRDSSKHWERQQQQSQAISSGINSGTSQQKKSVNGMETCQNADAEV